MRGEPRIGDVFGEMLTDAYAVQTGTGTRPLAGGRLPRPVIEIIERDDGLINGAPTAHYFAGPPDWEPYDQRAVARVQGATLDVGVGAGRVALFLQKQGIPVTGLDTSAGALAVCRRRGVRNLVHATVDAHVADGRRYDTFLLLGNNVGLLEGPERAPAFLAALAAMARPGAQVIAQGTNPYGTRDPVQTGYHEENRRQGRLGGQLRLRLRYRQLGTDWFDYLVCSAEELAAMVDGTPWQLVDVDDRDAPYYLATLRLAA
ncbi:2-polyprenyl-3-methyl-5-hydroxy-6-metoxy-1,4-benzoquinol methylase [Micromonospora pallida]|uniref:2-polyprenyl-3-methyl-5-hydroxy-6-metoxy-1,4-benzoquinol methylase n=1 Tax=Micromonospora pallida TaxID=145854 RepID=A0A1C6T8Y9_9ACTN|nr:class I SAM-dependent methyltransferase [Micromonospora pallida]SCL38137.1 2-polyprenyl-3-methyl-5-hydroxy-6-metoxy-1,4-benzoquinol methylase [Micromonospora pallida]